MFFKTNLQSMCFIIKTMVVKKWDMKKYDMEKNVNFNIIWTNLWIEPIHWVLNTKEMDFQKGILNATSGPPYYVITHHITWKKKNRNKSWELYCSQKVLLSMKGIDRGQAPYSPHLSPLYFLHPTTMLHKMVTLTNCKHK